MPCPEKDNAIIAYEEIWHEFPAPPYGAVSWIIRNDSEDTGITFLGRLADAYLAFRKTPAGAFTALREEREPDGMWSARYLIGDDKLPSMNEIATLDLDNIASRTSIEISSISYRVVDTAVEGKE